MLGTLLESRMSNIGSPKALFTPSDKTFTAQSAASQHAYYSDCAIASSVVHGSFFMELSQSTYTFFSFFSLIA